MSIVEYFAVGESTIAVHESLESGITRWLHISTEQSHLVYLKHRLKEIRSTVFPESIHFIIARVFEETFVIQMTLIELHWRPFVALHKLLELQEAEIPRITFFVN